jgi:hypothetical protein
VVLSVQVMDSGQVAEFGVPHELLQNPRSALLSLVEATGPASATYLRQVAQQAFQQRKRGIEVAFGTAAAGLPETDGVDEGFASPRSSGAQPQETSFVRFHMDDDETSQSRKD